MQPLYNEDGIISGYYIPEDQIYKNYRKVIRKWLEENMNPMEDKVDCDSVGKPNYKGNKHV